MKGTALTPLLALGLLSAACGRGGEGALREANKQTLAAPLPDCAHAACGDHFFVDAVPSAGCTPGEPCSLALTLVATGAFHINDEYPYRFKADDTAGVAFLGTDAAGKNVFSKAAGDWQKVDAKTATMTVKLSPSGPGPKTIAGNLKLSVCSADSCQLDQKLVSGVVRAAASAL